METVRTTLFEDPFSIYVILALAGAAIIVTWRTGGRSGRWLATRLLVVAVLAGGTFAVERLVVTDREQIQLALRDIAASIPAGRVDHAMTYIDDDYRGWGRPRDTSVPARTLLSIAIKAALAIHQVREIKLTGAPRIEIDGKLAECKVTAAVTYYSEGTPAKHGMACNVKWIKRPEGWRIQGAELTTDFTP